MEGSPQTPKTGEPATPTNGGPVAAVPPTPAVSRRNLAGTPWGSMRFSSSFRGNRPLPVPGPSRSQVRVNKINTRYGSGQHVGTYLSRAAEEMDDTDECPQSDVFLSSNTSGTISTRSYTAAAALNNDSSTAALHNGSSSSRRYRSIRISGVLPAEDAADDGDDRNDTENGECCQGLLDKAPQTVWHPNTVARPHRRNANLYWGLLLIGYISYIFLAISNCFERRKSPAVSLKLVDEPFTLPDVFVCFEGDSNGSRFGCFDGDAGGKSCTASFQGRVDAYGYGDTTSDSNDESNEHVVLPPDTFSDTCSRFQLSTLTAKEFEGNATRRFHILMFWNSFYNPSNNSGVVESIKMYLNEQGVTTEEDLVKTPLTLYPPISFDPTEVPFFHGFLEYEQHRFLSGETTHTYKVVDTTTAPWHNATEAIDRAALYGTDTLASIQLEVRTPSFYQYSEVDPHDILGTLGEIIGFWLVVPLLFGLLFYRPEYRDDDQAKMRSFSICSRRPDLGVPPPDAS